MCGGGGFKHHVVITNLKYFRGAKSNRVIVNYSYNIVNHQKHRETVQTESNKLERFLLSQNGDNEAVMDFFYVLQKILF